MLKGKIKRWPKFAAAALALAGAGFAFAPRAAQAGHSRGEFGVSVRIGGYDSPRYCEPERYYTRSYGYYDNCAPTVRYYEPPVRYCEPPVRYCEPTVRYYEARPRYYSGYHRHYRSYRDSRCR